MQERFDEKRAKKEADKAGFDWKGKEPEMADLLAYFVKTRFAKFDEKWNKEVDQAKKDKGGSVKIEEAKDEL